MRARGCCARVRAGGDEKERRGGAQLEEGCEGGAGDAETEKKVIIMKTILRGRRKC